MYINSKELYHQEGIPPPEGNTISSIMFSVDTAAQQGYLDVLKFLAKYNIFPGDYGIIMAAKNNHVDVLEWLSTKGIYPQMSYLDLRYLKPETIQWLKSKNKL